jgi:hypothetical protein
MLDHSPCELRVRIKRHADWLLSPAGVALTSGCMATLAESLRDLVRVVVFFRAMPDVIRFKLSTGTPACH